MSDLFPSFWQLLFPNFTMTTLVGIILIALGVFLFFTDLSFFESLGIPVKMISLITIMVGFVISWGFSIITDYWYTLGGKVVMIGTGVVLLVGFVLFYDPNKK